MDLLEYLREIKDKIFKYHINWFGSIYKIYPIRVLPLNPKMVACLS